MTGHVCLTCNMCCDGSMFTHVGVSEVEKTFLAERGSFSNSPDGSLRMQQKCSYLGSDGACGCYENRPGDCRKFNCNLLMSVESRFRTMEDAIEIAEEGKILREKTREAVTKAYLSANIPFPEQNNGIIDLINRLDMLHRLSSPISSEAFNLAIYRFKNVKAFVRQFITLPATNMDI
jgi:Fe-S-cluster containining protein